MSTSARSTLSTSTPPVPDAEVLAVRPARHERRRGDDADGDPTETATFRYYRPLTAIVTAVADAGLRVTSLEEVPFAEWPCIEGPEREGEWYVQAEESRVPLLFALRVEKPA